VQHPFLNPRNNREMREKVEEAIMEFAVTEGDHVTLLNVYQQFSEEERSAQSSWCQQHVS
jgi:hypothetical protein